MTIFLDHIKLLSSQIAKNLSLVFTGNIVAAGLGFISVLIISRELSVKDFGLFNLSLSIMIVVPYLIDLGINAGMIKFASAYLGLDKTAEASKVLKTTLLAKSGTSLVFTFLLYFGASFWVLKVFHYPDLIPLFKLSVLGVFSMSLFNYVKSALITYKLFRKCVFIQILVDSVKLLGVIALLLTSGLTAFNAVAVFALMPFLGLLAGLRETSQHVSGERTPVKNLFRELFSFGKWMFISNICTTVFPYIGIFMVAKMLDSAAAGIYGLAMNLTYIFPILIYSFTSVLLPEVSRFREVRQFETYVKRSLLISFFMGLTIIPILFFAGEIVTCLFGSKYLESVVVFNWLLLSYIALTMMIHVRIALFAMNLPRILAISDLFRVTGMILGCYLLIPGLGVQAPAVLSLVLNVTILGILSGYVFKRIRVGDISTHDETD